MQTLNLVITVLLENPNDYRITRQNPVIDACHKGAFSYLDSVRGLIDVSTCHFDRCRLQEFHAGTPAFTL